MQCSSDKDSLCVCPEGGTIFSLHGHKIRCCGLLLVCVTRSIMAKVWLSPALGDELVRGDQVIVPTSEVVADLTAGKVDITVLVQNMSSVLTHKEPECRERGMNFFSNVLKALPADYLSENQLKFISTFYTDRLKDNHRVIPPVIAGYLAVIEMKNFPVHMVGEFFTILFREVPCQSQLRVDRYNIYQIIQRLLETNLEYMKTLGPDFVFGVISAMDGERDPRNLMFLFAFLPKFMRSINLGHLVEEMFDVVSCYYPIDFNAAPGDPDAVSRQELADALAPCLCAVPEFAEQCLLLLIEKLDSSLRLAKIDSLQLLAESCNVFEASSYNPFLNTLWSSLQRELAHKTDNDLKLAAHRALYALVRKLSETENTDLTFENFVKGVLISMQTALADATTTMALNETAKILLTCANASKPSCLIIVQAMIPSTIAYHDLKMSEKVQIAAFDFLVKQVDVARHWNVLETIRPQMEKIIELCLSAACEPKKDHQIAGFKTVVATIEGFKCEHVVPFVEVLCHNVHYVQDEELISASVDCIHAIATKYPAEIMENVIMQKFNIKSITDDKHLIKKRLRVLSNLASIDFFTNTLIDIMLKIISGDEGHLVISVLSESMSDANLYTESKVEQIENDHHLVNSILSWLVQEVSNSASPETLAYGYSLISITVSRLTSGKQSELIASYTEKILDKCKEHECYLLILEALYNSLRQDVCSDQFCEILEISLDCALRCDNEFLRLKMCTLVAHVLNKVESEGDFDRMHSSISKAVTLTEQKDGDFYPRVIYLSAWVTKSLVLRGNGNFAEWLGKIVSAITVDKWGIHAAEAIRLIMTDDSKSLNAHCHCRTSLFYKQRVYQTFVTLTETVATNSIQTKEAYLLSMAYILGHLPESVLLSRIEKIAVLVVESLALDRRDLLLVMLDVAAVVLRARHPRLLTSLQTLLPRLLALTTYTASMDVRIKSLECVAAVAGGYPTAALLPHREPTAAALAPALDDRKRLVRAAAVRARSRWLLVGSPGEDAASN